MLGSWWQIFFQASHEQRHQFRQENFTASFFSLCSCRSSSVNVLLMFCREIWREFGGIFRIHIIKAQNFHGKNRSIFSEKFVTRINLFCANFVLQTCRPKSFTIKKPVTRNSLLALGAPAPQRKQQSCEVPGPSWLRWSRRSECQNWGQMLFTEMPARRVAGALTSALFSQACLN